MFTQHLQHGWQKPHKGRKKSTKQAQLAIDAWTKEVITRFLEHDAINREQSGTVYWESYT
jgi:hypothetical protein